MNCTKCNNTGWIFIEKEGVEYARKCDCVEQREIIAKTKQKTTQHLTQEELDEILNELR